MKVVLPEPAMPMHTMATGSVDEGGTTAAAGADEEAMLVGWGRGWIGEGKAGRGPRTDALCVVTVSIALFP